MEQIWAPWRIEYIQMEKPEGCILCEKPREDNDAPNYILYRGEKNFVIMNSYPYNPGHLMVAPYRHIANLEELTDEELREHFAVECREDDEHNDRGHCPLAGHRERLHDGRSRGHQRLSSVIVAAAAVSIAGIRNCGSFDSQRDAITATDTLTMLASHVATTVPAGS